MIDLDAIRARDAAVGVLTTDVSMAARDRRTLLWLLKDREQETQIALDLVRTWRRTAEDQEREIKRLTAAHDHQYEMAGLMLREAERNGRERDEAEALLRKWQSYADNESDMPLEETDAFLAKSKGRCTCSEPDWYSMGAPCEVHTVKP